MKKIFHSILAIFSATLCFGQFDKETIELNLGFEQSDATGTLPKGWVQWGSGYTIKTDRTIKKSGEASLFSP